MLGSYDIFINWLRRYSWFPKRGKLLKAFLHWAIALALVNFLFFVDDPIGWPHAAAAIISFFYLSFRHAVLSLKVMDIFISWLNQFRWFPTKEKRLKALIHWVVAIALVFSYELIRELAS